MRRSGRAPTVHGLADPDRQRHPARACTHAREGSALRSRRRRLMGRFERRAAPRPPGREGDFRWRRIRSLRHLRWPPRRSPRPRPAPNMGPSLPRTSSNSRNSSRLSLPRRRRDSSTSQDAERRRSVTGFGGLKGTAVRQGPDESEEEITTLLKGDTVISTGSFREKSIVRGTPPICKAGWCFVLANGHYGYVPEGTYRPARSVIGNSAF
jgi:hypothetical protein